MMTGLSALAPAVSGAHGDITIVDAGAGEAFKQFIELPYRIQGGDPNWVPPLRVQQRELLDFDTFAFYAHAKAKLFLAVRGGRAVGRIAAFNDDIHNTTHNERTTNFGFFESIDDTGVAAALFGALEQAAHDWGHDRVRGPFNPSISDEIGIQLDGFDRPNYVMIPGNPPYYRDLIEASGYGKSMDLFCYYARSEDVTARLKNGAQTIRERVGRNYTFRKVEKKNIARDGEKIWQIYNAAWEKNWFWVHASRAEFMTLVKNLTQIADFDLIMLAETREGEPVGFIAAVPNINEAMIRIRDGRLFPFGLLKLLWHSRPGAIRSLRVIAMGVLEEHRRLGVDTVLCYEAFKAGVAKGYNEGEMSQVLETNTMMVRQARMIGGRRYKTHRIFEKALG